MPGGFSGMGGMPGGGRSFHFSMGGGGPQGGFQFTNPEDVFQSFFKNTGASMGDADDDLFSSFGGRASGGFGGQRASRFKEPRARQSTPEVTTVEKPLPLTLEQLFKGTTKKMNIKRKTFEELGGKRRMEEKLCVIEIKPGYKAGTKIKFSGFGDQDEGGGTQDVVFVVTEVECALIPM